VFSANDVHFTDGRVKSLDGYEKKLLRREGVLDERERRANFE